MSLHKRTLDQKTLGQRSDDKPKQSRIEPVYVIPPKRKSRRKLTKAEPEMRSEVQPGDTFTKGFMLASGSYKSVWSLREREDLLMLCFDQTFPQQERIMNELELYSHFGKLGLSPNILYVFQPDRAQSFDEFLAERSRVKQHTRFIIERHNCADSGLEHFVNGDIFQSKEYFKQLKKFFTTLVVTHGYYNMDMKYQNLCYDPEQGFTMIDLDDVIPSHNKHYIAYMMFLLFIELRNNIGDRVTIQQTGISSREYDDMLDYIHETLDVRMHHNPVERICRYSESSPGLYLSYVLAREERGAAYLKEYKDALFSPWMIPQIEQESIAPIRMTPVPKPSYRFGYLLGIAVLAGSYLYGRNKQSRKKLKYNRSIRTK